MLGDDRIALVQFDTHLTLPTSVKACQ
jgi:hypothetical protein